MDTYKKLFATMIVIVGGCLTSSDAWAMDFTLKDARSDAEKKKWPVLKTKVSILQNRVNTDLQTTMAIVVPPTTPPEIYSLKPFNWTSNAALTFSEVSVTYDLGGSDQSVQCQFPGGSETYTYPALRIPSSFLIIFRTEKHGTEDKCEVFPR